MWCMGVVTPDRPARCAGTKRDDGEGMYAETALLKSLWYRDACFFFTMVMVILRGLRGGSGVQISQTPLLPRVVCKLCQVARIIISHTHTTSTTPNKCVAHSSLVSTADGCLWRWATVLGLACRQCGQ